MIQVTKDEFQALDKLKLIDHSKANNNYTIVNRQKKSCRKKYYVAETKPIMAYIKRVRNSVPDKGESNENQA